MNINLGLAKYAYRLVVTIMACCLSEERMGRASKFLRESEQSDTPKRSNKRKPVKKNNSS